MVAPGDSRVEVKSADEPDRESQGDNGGAEASHDHIEDQRCGAGNQQPDQHQDDLYYPVSGADHFVFLTQSKP